MKNDLNEAARLAEKKYGQNFLKDESYVEKIIQSMPDETIEIVEIGPGLGDLTKELVKTGCVTAYEVDERLCDRLRERFARELEDGTLHLSCTDVMSRWESGTLHDAPYALVANLPYYIATNLILKALRDENCRYILTMVQKEVAKKFSASEGEREFSSLSVLAASAGRAEILFEVPPEAFVPAPKVDSAVLSIYKSVSIDDEGFERFLKAAFSQPRKKLIGNLSVLFDRKALMNLFEALGVDENARPHQVATSVYHRIYEELKKDMTDAEQKRKYGKQKRRR